MSKDTAKKWMLEYHCLREVPGRKFEGLTDEQRRTLTLREIAEAKSDLRWIVKAQGLEGAQFTDWRVSEARGGGEGFRRDYGWPGYSMSVSCRVWWTGEIPDEHPTPEHFYPVQEAP